MSIEAVLKARQVELVTLVLPIQLLSKNQRDRLHFRQRHALRLSYEQIISVKYPRKTPTPDYRQRVTVTRVMGPRQREWDTQNIGAGSSIELLDSFVHLGWFKDDKPRWLEPRFDQRPNDRVREGPAVLVEIEAL